MNSTRLKTVCLLLIFFLIIQCTAEERFRFEPHGKPVPEFSADNAIEQMKQQVDFGPRYPGSPGHEMTRNFLVESLQTYAGKSSVFVQSFSHQGYGEDQFELYNIIAAFNPHLSNRILLAAHWDTRPRGEEDPDYPEQPILGADDGASGVGILLELARLFHKNPPPVGVDIILFDGEDYGRAGDLEQFFLGSRYWSRNQPVAGYRPRFAILLDMVGGRDAIFPKEVYSMQYAPSLVDAVWDLAAEMGFGDRFKHERGAAVSDDHVMVNRYTDISMINIIHHRRSESGAAIFPPWWHSQEDTMEIIDSETVQIVGDLVSELIYNRIPH